MAIASRHRTQGTVERDWPYDARDIVGDAVVIDLTYRGSLPSRNRPGKQRSEAKDEMRHQFSEQLWEAAKRHHRLLSDVDVSHNAVRRKSRLVPSLGPNALTAGPIPSVEHQGRWFSAIVTVERELVCHLDIVLLRRQRSAGQIVYGGDLDNSLKVILDALRVPQHDNETRPAPIQFRKGYVPPKSIKARPWSLCLLEDNSLITKLSIRADLLNEPRRAGQQVDFAAVHVAATLKWIPGTTSKDWMGQP